MRAKILFGALLLAAAIPTIARAQGVSVSVDSPACLPIGEHAAVAAEASGEPGGSTVRLYFRRLHEEVEDFYFVEMNPTGGGDYWTMLPQPADETLDEMELADPETDDQRANPWAAWWKAKELSDDRDPNDDLNEKIIEERASRGRRVERDWLREQDLSALQSFLEAQENEVAELYATVVDASGDELARSEVVAVPVRESCPVRLTPQEAGQAHNLVIGETAGWQAGRQVFHWECPGIVSRLNPVDVLRADEICRTCVVTLNPALFAPASAAVVGIIEEPEPVSAVRP